MKSPYISLLMTCLCLAVFTSLHALDLEHLPQVIDFELTNDDGTPQDWIIETNKQEQCAFVDTDQPFSGNSSLCIESKSDDPDALVISYLDFPRTFEALGIWVKFQYRITCQNERASAHLYAYGLDKNEEAASRMYQFPKLTPDTHEWKEASYYLRLNRDSSIIRLVIRLYGKGTVNIDHFHILAQSPEGYI